MVRFPFIHHWNRTILLCIPCIELKCMEWIILGLIRATFIQLSTFLHLRHFEGVYDKYFVWKWGKGTRIRVKVTYVTLLKLSAPCSDYRYLKITLNLEPNKYGCRPHTISLALTILYLVWTWLVRTSNGALISLTEVLLCFSLDSINKCGDFYLN
jgi:hypothetical protein